jgi:uncharacterized membrane protein
MPEQIKRMKTKTRVLNWTEWVGIALLIVFVISGAVVSRLDVDRSAVPVCCGSH